MKTSDVKIGCTYLTRIAGALCPVIVTASVERRTRWDGPVGPPRFRVARVGNRNALPLPRTAAALREVPAQTFHMLDQPWAVLVRRAFDPGALETRYYDVTIDTFGFATTLAAKSAAHAAVLAARGMVARAVFGTVPLPESGPLARLRYHVTGAVERGEGQPIVEVRNGTDKRIEQAYYRSCRGVQIDILKIGSVFAHGRALVAAGADDAALETGLRTFVDTIKVG